MSPAQSFVALSLLSILSSKPLQSQRIRAEPTLRLQPAAAMPGPTGVRTALTPTSVRLTWACPSGATGYEVYATPQGSGAVKLTAAPITNPCYQDVALAVNRDPRLGGSTAPTYISSFTHSGLVPATQVGYVVRALYPTGYGDSETVSAVTPLWPAPAGFASQLQGRTARLSWGAIPGATGYLVFRQLHGQSGFQQVTPAPTAATWFQDGNLPVGPHQYYLQAVAGTPSAPIVVTAGAPTDAGPAIYRGKPIVDFRWQGTADAAGVALVRSASPNGPFTTLKNVSFAKNEWGRDFEGLVGTTQYYKIVVTYPVLGAMESPVIPVMIPLPPQGITRIVATSPGPNTAKLSWACDPEAIGYSLLRGKGSEPMEWMKWPGQSVPMQFTACEFTDTGLWNGATYRYTIVGRYPDPNTGSEGQATVTVSP